MARKKRATATDQPIGVGLTAKQMKRKKPLNNDYLVDITPITDNQYLLVFFFSSALLLNQLL